jgi:microcystin-dependent protein
MFAGYTVPDNFLVCDGSAVSRTTYADLFDVIGTVYGAGDGSTTFNLPDLSGRVAVGASDHRDLGSTGGSESVVLLESNLPAHSHSLPAHSHSNDIEVSMPSLSHSITQPSFTYAGPSGATTDGQYSGSSVYGNGSTSTNATRSTNVAVADHPATSCTGAVTIDDSNPFDSDPAGSSFPHNNMQPYITMSFIIQAME